MITIFTLYQVGTRFFDIKKRAEALFSKADPHDKIDISSEEMLFSCYIRRCLKQFNIGFKAIQKCQQIICNDLNKLLFFKLLQERWRKFWVIR